MLHLRSNEELLILLKHSFDETAFEELLMRFLPLFKRNSRTIMIHDFEFDDYLQEARITLLQVIKKFDFSKQQFVAPYFARAYENRLLNHKRNRSAQKRNHSEATISLNESILSNVENTGNLTFEDIIYEKAPSLDDIVIARYALETFFQQLSEFEKKVLGMRLSPNDYSLSDIAQLLGTNKRAVENALSRCRKKCKQFFRY